MRWASHHPQVNGRRVRSAEASLTVQAMTKRLFDPREVDFHLGSQGHVATHAQLRELGVSMASITRRIGVGGPWQRLLPGVVLTHRGTPTRRELLLGARAFCGDDAVITGIDALIPMFSDAAEAEKAASA